MLLLPVGADEIVSFHVGNSRQRGNEFVGGLAVIERRNQWLDDRDGAIISARVTPSFEVVRFVHMPVTVFGGLVPIEAVMNAQRDVRALECIFEAEVGGCIVGGVAAHDDEHVDFAGAHVGNEIAQRFCLIDRVRVDGVGIEDGFADIAKLRVQRVREGVDSGGLVVARDDETSATVFHQVLIGRQSKIPYVIRVTCCFAIWPLIRQFTCDLLDLARPHRQPVIRLRARRGRRALDRIKAAHGSIGIAAASKIADIARVAREARIQEVRVERDDDVRL